ncbi:MAG: glutamyl-tRNA reductase [Myxococcales bacterium]|nr:glutamyl-tRNA reductase [Myxococcales bacterium]
MKVMLVGMNHRSAPVEVRERVAVDDVTPALTKLLASSEIDEGILLSTCNRTEVVVVTRSPDAARLRLQSFFRRDLADEGEAIGPEELGDFLYEYADAEAIGHLLRVASSLDSMVVGEPQILGQAKAAYAAAVDCGASGPILNRIYQAAFATAKRVRTETRIAERPVSLARVAVDLAKQIFEDLENKRALMVGAGEMIEMAMRSLRGAGLEEIAVANRTVANAESLAAEFGATAHGLDELPELMTGADVVLSCIGGDAPVITRAGLAAVLKARRNRPLFVIDLGVPRNVEPELDDLDNVYLYDIDDLADVASTNAKARKQESERAELIVHEECQRLDGWFAALRAAPTIKHLRERVERIRKGEVERALARRSLSDEQRDAVESLTRLIVNKILHAPMTRLKHEAETEEGMAYLEVARILFALDEDEGDA